MTTFNKISFNKSPNIDAFGRLRVSQVTTQFDAKQLHDALPLFIDQELNDTGTSTHSTTNAESVLTTSANTDFALLQTKQRFNYQSGKSQLLFWTFNNMDNETNVTKRVGYFSSNTTTPFDSTKDGFWLQSDGTNMSIQVSRSGTSTASVNRSAWTDPLDGTGASGITHDFDDNTIMVVSFEWLGVGEVQFGIVKDGVIIPFHYEDFTGTTGVYMSSPNQPMRWEIRQTGVGSGTLKVICSSVNSEGSINFLGKTTGIDDDGTHLDANSTSDWYVALGVKLNSDKVDTLIDLIDGYLLSATNDNFLYRVLFNPTYNGTVTYTAITDSSITYGLGATANTITADGYIMGTGAGASNAVQDFDIANAIRLGMNIDGTLDEIVIAVKPLSVNLDIHRGLTLRELT